MVGPPGEVDPPPLMRPDRLAYPDLSPHRIERTPLLHMQLNNSSNPGEQFLIPPDPRRIKPSPGHPLSKRHPVSVDQPASSLRRHHPGQQLAPETSQPEPRPFFLNETPQQQ